VPVDSGAGAKLADGMCPNRFGVDAQCVSGEVPGRIGSKTGVGSFRDLRRSFRDAWSVYDSLSGDQCDGLRRTHLVIRRLAAPVVTV
jgi:hypothetical protein